jgi:23S rRNA (guanosine2251-2'-O)-methyltransferase
MLRDQTLIPPENYPMAQSTKSHRRGGNDPGRRKGARRSGKPEGGGRSVLLYGRHAVFAAIENPRREVTRVLAVSAFIEKFGDHLGDNPKPEPVERDMLDGLLPSDAVHQGVACYAKPLEPVTVEELLMMVKDEEQAVFMVLDEVTDPRNVGAILRSAAAFGAAGLIVTRHNAANETGALAKAASGALDQVPIAEASNLRRTIDLLKEAGFWCLGLDHPAPSTMGQEPPPAKAAWILGAEGKGLRQLTAQSCDMLLSIPIAAEMESLNVSNAAAISLYEWARHHRGQ